MQCPLNWVSEVSIYIGDLNHRLISRYSVYRNIFS
jgi:hypothetical protein